MFARSFIRAISLPHKIESLRVLSARYETTVAKSVSTPDLNPNILDLRCGIIRHVIRHENAEKLYVSQIQVGPQENDTIQVCSGLVGLVPIEKMQDLHVVVVNNLKPSKMRGVKSEAMLLCADGPDRVIPISPPTTSVPGTVLGFSNVPKVELQDKRKIKSKAFETISNDLHVNALGQVTWRDGCILHAIEEDDIVNPDTHCMVKPFSPDLEGAQVR